MKLLYQPLDVLAVLVLAPYTGLGMFSGGSCIDAQGFKTVDWCGITLIPWTSPTRYSVETQSQAVTLPIDYGLSELCMIFLCAALLPANAEASLGAS